MTMCPLPDLICISVTKASENPARSTDVALIVGGMPLSQLRSFWLKPIGGDVLGRTVYRWLGKD